MSVRMSGDVRNIQIYNVFPKRDNLEDFSVTQVHSRCLGVFKYYLYLNIKSAKKYLS